MPSSGCCKHLLAWLGLARLTLRVRVAFHFMTIAMTVNPTVKTRIVRRLGKHPSQAMRGRCTGAVQM